MTTVELGRTGIKINAIGFGAMRLGRSKELSDVESSEIIRKIVVLGANFIDTADVYCLSEDTRHRNERQIRAALQGIKSPVVVATKGGLVCFKDTCVRFGKPEHIREAIRASHQALGGSNPIQLWQYHQYDRNYRLEDTLAPVREAMSSGLIQHVGVSNVSLEELKRAREIVEIATVQNEYSLWVRAPEESGLLQYCEAEGITLIAWRPLGGAGKLKTLETNDVVIEIARRRAASPAQIVLAWLLARSRRVLPIPGTTSPDHFKECFEARKLVLTHHEVELLAQSVPIEAPHIAE
jgi:aryl-alcohol dehydrogenase-like predicted oxidoreductase